MSKHLYKKYKTKYINLKKILKGGNQDIDNLLSELNDTDSYGGVLISENNFIIYEKYFNNTFDSQFRIFSCTKPVCGIAVMILIDQNKLSITDTIDKFYINIPNSDRITVWHLLNHESGIFDAVASIYFERKPLELFKSIYEPNENRTELLWFEQYVDLINHNEPDFEPGTNWKYNSAAYNIMGYIIYLVSGMKTTDFIRKYVFEPLNMNDSTFHTYPLKKEVLPFESENVVGVKEDYNFFCTDAIIITTLRDYDKFLNSYKTLISNESLQLYQKLYYFTNNPVVHEENIFFRNYINDITYPTKSNVFWHMGAGDFRHEFGNTGNRPGPLSKTIMIRFLDKNINFIISQNYEGSKKLLDKQRFNSVDLDNLTTMEKIIRYLSLK